MPLPVIYERKAEGGLTSKLRKPFNPGTGIMADRDSAISHGMLAASRIESDKLISFCKSPEEAQSC